MCGRVLVSDYPDESFIYPEHREKVPDQRSGPQPDESLGNGASTKLTRECFPGLSTYLMCFGCAFCLGVPKRKYIRTDLKGENPKTAVYCRKRGEGPWRRRRRGGEEGGGSGVGGKGPCKYQPRLGTVD
jgi:hypothetical protein